VTTLEKTQLHIANTLFRLRQQNNLSQVKLSEITGISRHTISRIETGDYGAHVSTLSILADAFDFPMIDWFCTD